MSSRHQDFDAALAAIEPITATLGGKTWIFPAEVPGRLILGVIKDRSFTDEILGVGKLIEHLLGKEALREMLDAGATWNQIDGLTTYLLIEYGLVTQEQVDGFAAEAGDDDPPA